MCQTVCLHCLIWEFLWSFFLEKTTFSNSNDRNNGIDEGTPSHGKRERSKKKCILAAHVVLVAQVIHQAKVWASIALCTGSAAVRVRKDKANFQTNSTIISNVKTLHYRISGKWMKLANFGNAFTERLRFFFLLRQGTIICPEYFIYLALFSFSSLALYNNYSLKFTFTNFTVMVEAKKVTNLNNCQLL